MKNSILRKTKLRLTLLAAIPLLMGLTSCQQEEDFAPLGGEAQEICVATRATTYDGNDDGFTEGHQSLFFSDCIDCISTDKRFYMAGDCRIGVNHQRTVERQFVLFELITFDMNLYCILMFLIRTIK